MGWILISLWACFPSLCLYADAMLTGYTARHKLFRALLKNYDRNIVPVLGKDSKITVDVSLHLLILRDLDTKEQLLSSNGYLRIRWYDELLTWNPEDYDNIDNIVVSQTDIWVPNLLVDNPADDYVSLGNKRTLVRVHADGYIVWEPDFLQTTSCPVDITKYPFDLQVCEIRIRSWTHHNETVIMVPAMRELEMDYLLPNGEWDVAGTETAPYVMSITMNWSKHTVSGVSFVIQLYRKRFFYILNTIIPVMLLSSLNVLVFVVPSDCGERMTLAVSALLAFTVYLSIISQNIPKISDYTSLLAMYLTFLLGLSTASVIFAGIVINVHFRDPAIPVPECLFWFLGRYRLKEMATDNNGDKSMMVHSLEEKLQCRASSYNYLYIRELSRKPLTKNSEKEDMTFFNNVAAEVDRLMKDAQKKRDKEFITWTHIAAALDRFLFWAFFFLTGSANAVFLALLMH